MPALEIILATVLVGGLLYAVDRGIAFHVCLYSAIASRGKFTSEQAYRATQNPFVRAPKLMAAAALLSLGIYLGISGGIRTKWEIASVVLLAACYVLVSTVYAVKAFRRTQFGSSELR